MQHFTNKCPPIGIGQLKHVLPFQMRVHEQVALRIKDDKGISRTQGQLHIVGIAGSVREPGSGQQFLGTLLSLCASYRVVFDPFVKQAQYLEDGVQLSVHRLYFVLVVEKLCLGVTEEHDYGKDDRKQHKEQWIKARYGRLRRFRRQGATSFPQFGILPPREIALTFNKFTNNVEKNRGRDGDRHPFQVM